MNRRDFLRGAAGAALTFGVLRTAIGDVEAAPVDKNAKMDGEPKMKKAILFSMLPESLSIEDKFKLAHDVGFAGVEAPAITDSEQVKTMRKAADKAEVRIHSVMYGGWEAPLSSPDPKVREQGALGLANTLKAAKELGADGVLLVPAFVNEGTRYIDAYERSQKEIKKLIPTAEKLEVQILIEDVWNNFLLSPIEFARYVDEFKSPWVQAYFDVGNVVAFGWSEDWVRTLGHRIKKIHLKDFKRGPRQFCNLMDGDVNWPEVRKALGEVGYKGYLTPELDNGGEAYLRDLSSRVDKIIAG